MSLAPIALFVYKRLHHTQQTVLHLQNNHLARNSDLFIFSDAAKNEAGIKEVNEVREWIKTIEGFKSVSIINRDKNYGLAESIITGVSQILDYNDRIIVVEDDLIVSPYFLDYMNDGLHLYSNSPLVASIHGYNPPLKPTYDKPYFLKGADCWGWGTWRRAWKYFEPDGLKLLLALQQKDLIKEFDFNGKAGYLKTLKDQINKKNNSWAIRWHASAFINNMYTLYPGKSMVCNIGNDNTGEHSISTQAFDVNLHREAIELSTIPINSSLEILKLFTDFFVSINPPLYKKIILKIKGFRII